MTTQNTDIDAPRLLNGWLNGWRIAGWGALLALLVLPAIAMRFTREVQWTGSDFVFAAVLLFLLGFGVEVAMRIGRNAPQRVGMMIATLGGFMTVWINGAVGMIGSENEPINLTFIVMAGFGVLASLAVWFRPHIMRWIMGALALGQYGVGIAALYEMPGHAVEWGVLTFFAFIWAGAAACFHRAVTAARAGSAR